VVPLQQPAAQEAASQTQLPLVHSWPLAQATQALPAEPQLFVDDGWQAPLESQQPLGQVAALHEPQVWLAVLHSWPVGQSPLPLQPQTLPRQMWPMALLAQSRQAPPVVPQAWSPLPGAQLDPEQQPPVQVPSPGAPQAAVHEPAVQVGARFLQTPQLAPPVPHDELVCAA
jgi:hypothetical protein